MKNFFTTFTDSAKEFTNLRSLVATSLLVALHTILALFLSIQVSDSLRISISFITDVVIGAFFGPVIGFVSGILGDIIQFILKPTGAFNIGLTLNSGISGLIYGLFFYKKFPKPASERKFRPIDLHFLCRCIIAVTVNAAIVNMLLSTYWIALMLLPDGNNISLSYYVTLFVPRCIKNLIQLPINIILSYYALTFMRHSYNSLHNS